MSPFQQLFLLQTATSAAAGDFSANSSLSGDQSSSWSVGWVEVMDVAAIFSVLVF